MGQPAFRHFCSSLIRSVYTSKIAQLRLPADAGAKFKEVSNPMNESNLSARRAYDRFQFAFSMFSLAMIFASLIAVAFFDVKSYVIVLPIAVYLFISIVAGLISGFHVGMIFLPRVGHIKVEEHPKLFWGVVVMLILVTAAGLSTIKL